MRLGPTEEVGDLRQRPERLLARVDPLGPRRSNNGAPRLHRGAVAGGLTRLCPGFGRRGLCSSPKTHRDAADLQVQLQAAETAGTAKKLVTNPKVQEFCAKMYMGMF